MTNDIFSFNTSNFDKFFVGADKILENLSKAHEAAAKAIPGYPPYNIVKVDDNKYVIEMAVAGFGKNNLEIELANSVLTVKGGLTVDDMANETVNPVSYIYKGIADRAFTRKFTLADSVEIKNAELVNGMLKLWLENIIPESKKPKKIDITSKD
jgi:molecular chaperone IbpA